MSASRSPTKAFQWDLARQVERLDFLLKWLPRYAEWGYDELYLHLEDAVEYPSLPGVARRDAYSYRQFTRLVDAATRAGIKVVPIVNLLGHTQYLIKAPELRDLNELRDAAGRPLDRGQICPLHPRTMEIAGKLLRDMAPFCTAGKVHVGLDESFHLGQCPRCRADVERRGLAAHFAGHVEQLHQLTSGMGLRMGLWADMLALLPAAISLLPRDLVAYDWYYYPFPRHPRVELRNFAEVDLATPLQAHGIEYWGCPMNGAFRYEPMPAFGDRLANIRSWWRRCRQVGASGFLITSWEANRLAIELTTAVDAAAACLWLDPGVEDPREMLARGFGRVFGGSNVGRVIRSAPRRLGDKPPYPSEICRWAHAALACDELAFAGYPRWQINDRWDVCAVRDGVAKYEKELRALEELCRSLLAGDPGNNRLRAGSYRIAPPALRASVAFRIYLAQRDVFVRRAAVNVFRLRRISSAGLRPAAWIGRRSETDATFAVLRADAALFATALRAGRAAARAMWNRSRDPRRRGPNELMLDRDAKRLREWLLWLRKAERDPLIVWRATPVCGALQLQFTIHNFAPALQKIVVEQRGPDGTWTQLHESHLIEFRAFAARPRTRIHREFSVPIPAAASGGAENAETLKAGRLKQGVGSAISRYPAFPIWFTPHAGARGDTTIQFPRAGAGHDLLLRLAVRGVGQIALSHIALTDGVTRIGPRGWAADAKRILGRPARQRGFPAVDFSQNSAAIELRVRRGHP
jgi:Glycosyl hydrolase family 20, catalytic domain